jgi:heme-degrading monooxygenase HmoA
LLQTPGAPVFPSDVSLECLWASAEDGTSIFVILWEFEVKPGNHVPFENAYSPSDAWVQLFQRDTHFLDIQLLQDSARPPYYFTLDFWDTESSYKTFSNSKSD